MVNKFLIKTDTEGIIKSVVEVIIYCSIPTFSLVAIVLVMSSIFGPHNLSSGYSLVMLQQSIPILLAYGVIPCVIFKLHTKKSFKQIGIKKNKHWLISLIDISVFLVFTTYLISNGVFQNSRGIPVIHYFFVAVAEELLVRGIILYQLNRLFRYEWLSIIASAIIFSLVFHSTDGILLNMAYRIPFGIITAILMKTTGSLTSPILLHWLYNSLLSI